MTLISPYRFSILVLAADKALIVDDFNTDLDNEKHALGLPFIDILNSISIRQHVSGPTHSHNHSLDLIFSQKTRKKTKLEIFCIAWKDSISTYRRALKTA